ncbi:MAG: cytochrome c [Polaribacter sp.]|nr:cytochrome c [Polaribacter sp.]
MKSHFKIRKEFLVLLVSVFFVSCITNVEEDDFDEREVIIDSCAEITFSQNIKPIIDAACIDCHGIGGNFPNLKSYSTISSNANSVKAEVVSRRMPKGISLKQSEIDAIVCWVESGALDN